MKVLLMILPFFLLACQQTEIRINPPKPLTGYWISKNLEYYVIDSAAGGGQTSYGSGYLLRLDSNGNVISLGADFYWDSDSLYLGGEPGMTLKEGSWHINGNVLLLTQKLKSKTIMLTSDQIGQSESDTLILLKDNSMRYKNDTLVFVRNTSSELEILLDRIILFNRQKNGS